MGLFSFPPLRLHIWPSDGQLRVLSLLTQEVAYIDLEDHIENFVGVNGGLAVIRDYGILIPLRGRMAMQLYLATAAQALVTLTVMKGCIFLLPLIIIFMPTI